MRTLRPDRLFVLGSGLWVLDAVQPVAAVLDPATGGLRHLVSWNALPPADRSELSPGPVVLTDGEALWTQQEAAGALVRVDVAGVTAAVWTDGLRLAACGPGVAWCAPERPVQELVAGPDARPVRPLHGDELLRVTADGRCDRVRTEQPVRSVRPDERGLLVQVDVDGWTLRHLGADTYEVVRPTRWLLLPWDAHTPGVLTVERHALPEDARPGARTDAGSRGPFSWYDLQPGELDEEEEESLLLLGLTWRFGSEDRGGRDRAAVATAARADGGAAGRWQLGPGTVQSVAATRDRVVVIVSRDLVGYGAADVLAVDPAAREPVTLLAAGGLDIAGAGWPLPPRPLDAESYLQQVLARNSSLETYWRGGSPWGDVARPLVPGMSRVSATLVGTWPHTQLEWTFALVRLPGLVLRRRVPLFDELGRPEPPLYADVHLLEDLETGALPPASEARDGVLDV